MYTQGCGFMCLLSALRPLADSEKKLPVRTHRPDEVLKSPVEDGEGLEVASEPKKKCGKEKKDKERKVRPYSLCPWNIFHIFDISVFCDLIVLRSVFVVIVEG